MTSIHPPTGSTLPVDKVAAEAELARLTDRVKDMRAVLVRLLQDVVVAESKLGHGAASELLEANQNLAVAALLSQNDSELARQALDEVSRHSALDALTQLPNRALLLDRFAVGIANAKRNQKRVALLFIDLDHFKQINDTTGHAAGDDVLRLVAQRLQGAVRAGDTVSRHGGDEFLVLLCDVAHREDAALIAEKLIHAIAAPTHLGNLIDGLSASIGISIYPDDGVDADELISCADAAMYQAKRMGPGGYIFFGGAQTRPMPLDDGVTTPAPPQAPVDWQTQLREANQQLVLAALNAHELKEAAEQAQERQAAFIDAVADELRNPMAPIRIAASMLGRNDSDAPLLRRVHEIVDQQMKQIAILVSDGLEAAQSSALQQVLARSEVDMAEVITAAVSAYQPVFAARHQHFTSVLPAGPLPICGDRLKLTQIAANLLDNASKHSAEGGHIALDVQVDAAALTMDMTVSDDGLGIGAPMVAHVFEPFAQDTAAFGLRGPGLGIGLAASRKLAQAHGGNLVAQSAGIGQGSQFVLRLPLVRPGSGAPPRATSPFASQEPR